MASTVAEADGQILRALADDLQRDPLAVTPDLFLSREERIAAVTECLLHGTESEFGARELAYLKRLGVPRSRIAAATTER